MCRRTRVYVAAAVSALVVTAEGPAQAATYYGTVGPTATITLKRNGVKVTKIPAGLHTYVIRDARAFTTSTSTATS